MLLARLKELVTAVPTADTRPRPSSSLKALLHTLTVLFNVELNSRNELLALSMSEPIFLNGLDPEIPLKLVLKFLDPLDKLSTDFLKFPSSL